MQSGIWLKGMTIGLALVICGCATTTKQSTLANSKESRLANPAEALAFRANRKFGSGLSRQGRREVSIAEARALEYGEAGQEIGWKLDGKSTEGTVSASSPFRVGQANCRRFEHRLQRNGSIEQSIGTACRRNSGPWNLIE